MKTRNGFVSNSSSSSFVINLNDLDNNKFQLIRYKIRDLSNDEKWQMYIDENNFQLCLSTDMDNFNMYQYLISIGVDECAIKEA